MFKRESSKIFVVLLLVGVVFALSSCAQHNPTVNHNETTTGGSKVTPTPTVGSGVSDNVTIPITNSTSIDNISNDVDETGNMIDNW
ncbi:MAG: hypothetical protein GWP09_00130 [Nitrospiraceae bacterium]|nr:hypothetical protein [Nitrospiraceae bacterium]